MTILLAIILFCMNGYATWVLVYCDRYDAAQKWVQVAIIWLVPVVGAILIWSLARDRSRRRTRRDAGGDAGFGDGDLHLDNYSSAEVGDFGGGCDGGAD